MKLVFVYNADSGLFNALTDIAHKIFSPETYECQLCAITHSAFKERDEWKHYIENLGIKTEFLHRDEFVAQYKLSDVKFPAVFLETGGEFKQCIFPDDLASSHSIEELKELIAEKCVNKNIRVNGG